MKHPCVLALLAACSGPSPGSIAGSSPDASLTGSAGDAPGPGSASIYDSVNRSQLQARLEELTGVQAVTIDGAPYRITNRWAPDAKAKFRTYWQSYFEALGAKVTTQTFPIPNLVGETMGHNLEAVLPGASPDSLVIIVHYDTVGITGKETENPGADDDGGGVAMQMEAARLFAAHAERDYTVRFVAADYEEISDNLDGDYAYVRYLQQLAQAQGFKILAASDNDQVAWSCWSENLCGASSGAPDSRFQVISCSGDSLNYSYPMLTKGLVDIASAHGSTVTPVGVCDGSGDTDHYPFWQAGIPAYVIEEWGSENNPHYDDTGDDTMAHIDMDLFAQVSRLQISFQAQLAGVR